MLILSILLMLSPMAHSQNGVKYNERDIKELIKAEAIRQDFSVHIALGVAKVESGFRTNAIGGKGERGLFQLLPSKLRPRDYNNVRKNIELGISELRKWQILCPVKEDKTFVICYNQGGKRKPKYPKLHPYYKKVMIAMENQ